MNPLHCGLTQRLPIISSSVVVFDLVRNWVSNRDPLVPCTDNGHPERAFFQKFETFGLWQTNWAEIFWGILAISSQIIGTILVLWVPCSWESVAGSFSYKKRWFLGLKHATPKYSQNKILAVKNLEKSLRTSVFGVICYLMVVFWICPISFLTLIFWLAPFSAGIFLSWFCFYSSISALNLPRIS